MSIQETLLKIKGAGKKGRIALECLVLALVLSAGFLVYSQSVKAKSLPAAPAPATTPEPPIVLDIPAKSEPVSLAPENTPAESAPKATLQPSSSKKFAASKSGKVYYPIDCKALGRVKSENRIYFSNETEAKAKNLTLSKSCH
ncbi:MAG: hypothetical protein JWM20_209 [Patescibacteria group bacterium]|nr:hypothetical protein [Patescibacteria group bacterium]